MSQSNLYFILPLLLISQIFEISNSQSLADSCHPNERKVLTIIKHRLGNPSSLSSWDTEPDCANWAGIISLNKKGFVTSLDISNAPDIRGQLTSYIGWLSYLTELRFSNIPNLSGPIPSYLGEFPYLESITITGTNITGPIPDFLGRLYTLSKLDLSSNQLTGSIPNILGNIYNLNYLDLSSNKLTGRIPYSLNQLVSLSYLQLRYNKLSGPVPGFLSRLKNLNTIDFDHNSLRGPIPEYLGRMPNLTAVSMSNNQLTGPIPKSFGLGTLGMIDLSKNRLTGEASFLFEKTNKKIVVIEVDYNYLEFDFSNVDLSRALAWFNVSHNMIYGSLPKRLGQLWVDSIDVSYNQLCGPIPNGRRFKRVNPAVFGHNKCLCGGPLPPCK